MKISKPYLSCFFKQLVFIILIGTLACCTRSKPRHDISPPREIAADDIITKRDIPLSHKQFMARFLPQIRMANNKILHERNMLYDFQDSLESGHALQDAQLGRINRLLVKYRLGTLSRTSCKDSVDCRIDRLLKRADIIPSRLVMAQAIIESGWGTSNFAIDGNNYFGIRCYREGCGMKPAGIDSASFYVKTYTSEMAGIEDYLRTLNTGYAYRGIRDARLEMRQEGAAIDPLKLIHGLNKYSEKRDDYITMVSNIIRNYTPVNTDVLLRGSS